MKRLRTFLAMVLVLVAHTAYAADFTQVAGLNGGMVTSIGTTTTGTIIAGTSAAGAFRSTDNGQTWTKITDGISASEILSVGISAGGNILLGTKTNGLFRSDNNGANFAPVGDISTGAITAIRTSANAVYVGTENGIYKSTDNGAAFIQMSGLPSGSAVTAIAVDNSNNVLVGNNAGKLFLSTVATPNGFVEFPFQVTQGENFSVRALAQDAQGNLYASFENNGVYKLTSGGFVWDPISLGSSVVTATSIASTADGRMYITVDGNGIYRSDTNGDNFEQFNLGLTDVNVVSMATATGSQLLVGTKTDGIFRTNAEGTGFTRVGVPALTVTRIATLPGTRVIYAGTASSGIYISKNDGQTWEDMNVIATDGTITGIATSEQGFAVVATNNNGIHVIRDNGSFIRRLDTTPNISNVTSVAISNIGNIYAGTQNGLFRMTSTGTTFTQITAGIANNAVQSISLNAAGNLIVRTAAGLFISTDGNNFTEVPNSSAFAGAIDIATSAQGSLIAAAMPTGVIRSTNSGTFETISAGLEGKTILSIAIDGAGNILVGTTQGLYALMASGTSFTQVAGTSSFEVTAVSAIQTVVNGNSGTTQLLLGVRGNSMYRGTYEFTSGPDFVSEIPTSVGSLGINMPNPVNSTMIIPFSVAADQHAIIKIYDAMGTERATILNGIIGAGTHTAAFDVANLPAGTYFYRLMIGGAASQRAFVVVR